MVCRLVHQRFFTYAADRYIRAHPPTGPCLFVLHELIEDRTLVDFALPES